MKLREIKTNTKLRLCIHQLYSIKKEIFEHKGNIEIIYANESDVMDEMVNSKLLITDYSSLGFDYTFFFRLITSMFLHGGIIHLGLNMYCLYIFL